MSRSFAIADTCFLIDWARYRGRDLLFKLYVVYVPESVLREVKSESTIAWIASRLASGDLALFTETESEVEEARSIVERSRRMPNMPGVDLPEAVCIAVGRRRGYVVLTENRGALKFVELAEDYAGVTIRRSLEILSQLQLRGHLRPDCGDPALRFREYEEDTKHLFPRKDLLNAVAVIRRELCGEAQEVGGA